MIKTTTFILFTCFALITSVFTQASNTKTLVLNIDEAITIATTEYITRAHKKAAEDDSINSIIIKLNTPGGLLEATRDIVKLMLSSDTPFIVWVSPSGARAASAGSMITMAAHYAAMAPSTSIGAATPVNGSGKEINKDMKSKILNDTISFVTGIANKRNKNAQWAKESVTQAASLDAKTALEKKVIDGVHSSIEDVWIAFAKKNPSHSKKLSPITFNKNIKEKTLSFISNPNIAYGLMTLGVMGLYYEITHPGTIVPGVIGAICLSLGAITSKILPIRPGAFVLLFVGLILLAIELLTAFSTFGILGIGGIVCIILSGVFLIDLSQTNIGLDLYLWLPIAVFVILFMGFLSYLSFKALKNKNRNIGPESIVGQETTIFNVSKNGQGKIKVEGEIWNCQTQGKQALEIGQQVKIIRQDGLTAIVEII